VELPLQSPPTHLLTDFLLRRAATRPTITYSQLVDGAQINGAYLL
jgi:hypothetical protein